MDQLAPRVLRRFMASLSDNPEKWRGKTKSFDSNHFQKTKRFRAFTLHWRPTPRDPGYFEMVATIEEGYRNVLVVASLSYGPWNTEDESRLEGAIEVDPRYRRQGLATAMYDWAEDLSGLKFAPASSHTNDAEAFWRARKR